MSRPPALLRLLLVVASMAFAACVGEVGARLTEAPKEAVAATRDQYKFYRFDPVLGWSNAPGMVGTFERPEFKYPIVINQHGMRYRPVDEARTPGVTRVAVLGDSFVWGLGAKDEERITEQAEALSHGKVEYLNFGVSGYAPVQYDLMVDQVAAFHPDLVVIVFCLANDFIDNVRWLRYGYYKPYAELDGDGFAIKGYPLPNVGDFAKKPRQDSALSRWLDGHSSLYRRLAPIGARFGKKPENNGQRGLAVLDEWGRELYADPGTLSAEQRDALATLVEIDRRLLKDIAARLGKKGLKLLVLPAPTKCELGGCFDGPKGVANPRAMKELAAECKGLGIPFLDTSDTLTMADFWEQDIHWNPAGHKKMAEALARWVEGAHLEAPGAEPPK